MAIRDLIPWRRRSSNVPVRRHTDNPFLSLQDDMNQLFDRFFSGTGFGALDLWPGSEDAFAPSVDVEEHDKEIRVQAELPGMDESNIELALNHGALTIQGEKKEEREEKDNGRTYSERRYGRFSRTIPLPAEVDEDKVEATFKNGVLTVTLPKTPEAQQKRKRIEVRSSS